MYIPDLHFFKTAKVLGVNLRKRLTEVCTMRLYLSRCSLEDEACQDEQ